MAGALLTMGPSIAGTPFVAPAAAQSQCVNIQYLPGSGVTQISNYCSERVSVFWRDGNYCNSGPGCMEVVASGSTNHVTAWQGNTSYCICWGYDICCDL